MIINLFDLAVSTRSCRKAISGLESIINSYNFMLLPKSVQSKAQRLLKQQQDTLAKTLKRWPTDHIDVLDPLVEYLSSSNYPENLKDFVFVFISATNKLMQHFSSSSTSKG